MGPMLLFTGYRSADSDLHATEKAAAVEAGVLDYAFLALSRSPPLPKVHFKIRNHNNSTKISTIINLEILDLRPG